MTSLVESIRRHRLWTVAVAYAVLALTLLATAWGVVALLDVSMLYVRLLAVFALLGLPMVVGLAWAIRERPDGTGKGHVVRDRE